LSQLERARAAAAERRAKVDPNQLSLLQQFEPQAEAESTAPDSAPVAPSETEADCWRLQETESAVAEQPDPGLGEHEYKVAERLDQPNQEPPASRLLVRARKSGWI
jgi:hypothetical protein